MLEENIALVIDILISNDMPMSVAEITEESELEQGSIINVINTLKIFEIIKKENDNKFVLIKQLKAIQIARAAQIGIDLLSFNYFNIDKKEKQLALELATQSDKIKNIEISSRKPLLKKRSYMPSKSDNISDNLILLLEASNASLYDYLTKLAKKDEYLSLLMNLHEQAEKSLQNYMEYLK